MSRQENWKSFKINFLFGFFTLGLALAAKALYSHYTTGQPTLFFRQSKKMAKLEEVQHKVNALFEAIPSESNHFFEIDSSNSSTKVVRKTKYPLDCSDKAGYKLLDF